MHTREMEPTLTVLKEKTLAGHRQRMSLHANSTVELWRSFIKRQKMQPFPCSPERYSVQVFDPGYFQNFSPETTFEKWAAVEVAQSDKVPADLEMLILPGGLYAVFMYRGPAKDGPRVFQYILTEWLPASSYMLDNRPHFEVLGDKYHNEDPASEEEIWIPVKPRLEPPNDAT